MTESTVFNMRNILVMIILIFTLLFTLPTVSFAQGMMGGSNMMGTTSRAADNSHTAIEETKGKDVFNKLQSKQIDCKDLSEDNFASLGEYYMGQMTGTSHEAMNSMMIQMMGEESEKQMHIAMGKRLSGCDTSAQIPSPGAGFMPMMSMMQMMGGRSFMMDPWAANSPPGILNIISQVLIVIVLTLLAIWLWKQIKKK